MAKEIPENVINKQVSNRLSQTNQATGQQPKEEVSINESPNNVSAPAINQEDLIAAENYIKDNNINANDALESINKTMMKSGQLGETPSAFDLASQMDAKAIPFYDKYEGSASEDFYNSMMNAGYVRTLQGVSNIIPTVVSAVTDADWANEWIDNTNEWADKNQGLISSVGEKSFFDTWDMRSLAAGAGQGFGSMLPMLAASAVTGGLGGVAGLLGGTGLRAGAAAASAAWGGTAQVAASSINMMPALQEEGLAMGLTHQQASGLALAVAPIIGLMEKTGLEAAIGAGFKPAIGKIEKEVIKNSFKDMAASGLSAKNFNSSLKVAIGSLAKHYHKDLAKKGVKKAWLKAGMKEAKVRSADMALRVAQGSAGEGGMEFLQSMTETAAKQMYDNYFASENAKVGEGKFGADILSEEAFTQALEEGFYGGLIGGSFSGASRMANGLRAETVTSALDKANQRGTLNEEVERMNSIIETLQNEPKDKQDLRDVVKTASEVVGSITKNDVSNTSARMQIFQLSHYAKTLQNEIAETNIKGGIPAIDNINQAKADQLNARLKRIDNAITTIYETNNTVDLNTHLVTAIEGVELYKGEKKVEEKTKPVSHIITDESDINDFNKALEFEVTQDGIDKIIDLMDNSSVVSQEDKMKFIENAYKKRESVPKAGKEARASLSEKVKGVVKQAVDTVKKVVTPTPKAEVKDIYSSQSDEDLKSIAQTLVNNKNIKGTESETDRQTKIASLKQEVKKRIDAKVSTKESVDTGMKQLLDYDSILESERAGDATIDKVLGKFDSMQEMVASVDEYVPSYDGVGANFKVTDRDGNTRYFSMVENQSLGEVSKENHEYAKNSNKAYENFQAVIDILEENISKPEAKPKKIFATQDLKEDIANKIFVAQDLTAEEQKIYDDNKSEIDSIESETEIAMREDAAGSEATKVEIDELTSDIKPSTETELETEANIAAKKITERLKAEAKKKKAETKEAVPSASKEKTAKELGIDGGWRQVLNSLNKQLGKPKHTDITIERFNALSEGDITRIAMDSKTAKKTLADRAKADVTAITPDTFVEPEVETAPVAEVAPETTGQLDLFDMEARQVEDFGEEGNAIIANRLKRDSSSKRSKKSRSGLTSALSSNPVQFARVLEHMRKIFPQMDINVLERLYDENGLEVLGLAKTGGVDINENSATQDTLFHELGHHFVKMLSGDRLYNDGITMIKDTPYMDMAKELYPDESVEDQAEEALMMLVGEKSVDMINTKLDGSILQKALAWLKKFWNRLKHRLGKASASDIAEIMAADLAFRNSPVLSSGLVIDGNKYSKTLAQKDRASHNAIRNASIMMRIEHDKAPSNLKRKPRFVDMLFNEILADEYYNLLENNQLPANVTTFKDWKEVEGHKQTIEEFKKSLGLEYSLDPTVVGLSEEPVMAQTYMEAQGIDSQTKIDKNVKAVLDTLRDINGNKIEIDKIYGIAARVAELTEHPSEFLDNLNERFIDGKFVNSLDTYIARELYDTLSALPSSISNPIVTQLTSVHNIPMERVTISKSGIFNNTSNESWSKNDINNLIQNYILSEFDRQRIHGKVKARARFLGAALGENRVALKAIKKWEKAGTADSYTKMKEATEVLEKRLQNLTGIGELKSSWFTGIEESYVKSRSATKRTQGTDATTLKNMTLLVSDIVNADKKYNEEKGISYSKRRRNYSSRLRKSLIVVAHNLDSSHSVKGSYRNVVGNQMSSFRVGGFMHKFFNKPSYRSDERMNFEHISDTLTEKYKSLFNKINKGGQPVVSHADGLSNQITGQSVEAKNMNEADTNWFNFMMFGTSLKDGVIKSNMGILGDRGFFTFAKVPLLKGDDLVTEMNEVQKYAKKNGLLELFNIDQDISSDEQNYQEMYDKLSTEEATRAFGAHSSRDLGDFVSEYYTARKTQLADRYPRGREPWSEIEETISNEIDIKIADGTFLGQFKEHIDGEMPAIIETFIANDMLHRFNLQMMSLGDINGFKNKDGKLNSKNIVKRFKGGTTPYTVIDYGKDKNGNPKKIISITLKSIKTQSFEEFNAKRKEKGDKPVSFEEYEKMIPSATDSQEYFNDYIVGKIQESGGALIDYGNTFKTVINGTGRDSQYHYHKTSSIGFKGVDADKGYYQMSPEYKGRDGREIVESHHMRINKVLQQLSEQYPDTPIKIIDEEGVKSNAGEKIYTLEALESEVFSDNGFDIDGSETSLDSKGKKEHKTNSLKIDQEISGVQFDISKDVTKKGVDVAFSTQLGNLIPSLATAIGVPELALKFEEQYAKLIMGDLGGIVKALGNKEETMKRVLEASEGALSSVDKRMIETALREGADTFDHVGTSRKIQNFMSAQFGKALSKRVNGAELLQTVDATGTLRYHTSGENGEIIHAEVLVPEGFAELGEELITVRIPLSAPASIMIVKVVGFTPKGGNSIVAPKAWIDASNADNDGDKLFAWKKGTKARGDDMKFNGLFDTTSEILRNRKLIGEGTGFDYELDIKNVKEDMLQAKVNTGQYKSKEAARKAIDGGLDISTGSKMVAGKKKLDESQTLVGIFAVGSKVMHEMNRLGATLLGGYNLFGDTRIKQDKTIGLENINSMAEILQYELDNAAEFSADEMGITINNAPLAVIALSSGNSTEDIFTFLNSDPIREVEKRIRENKKVHGAEKPAFVKDIINDVRNEMTGSYKVGKNSMSAKVLLDKYEEGLKLSRRPEYNLLTSLTQLDKRPPNDLITLYKLLADIETHSRIIGKTQAELKEKLENGEINQEDYNNAIEVVGKAKELKDGAFRTEGMLENPVLAARIKVAQEQRTTLEKYFQLKTSKMGDEMELRETIDSFAFGRVNVNRQKLSDLVNRVQTERIAQGMGRGRVESAEDVDRLLGYLADTIRDSKEGRKSSKEWLSLVTIDNDSGLLVPMHGVSVKELGIKVGEENNVQVSEEYIRNAWAKLPRDLQNMLVNYTIYVDGFSGGATSIMHLLPDSIYEEYQREVKKVAKEEQGISNDLLRNIAIKGIDDIKVYDDRVFRGDSFADSIATLNAKEYPSKFFTLIDSDGVKHLYERGKLDYDYKAKSFSFSAAKVTSDTSNVYVQRGNKKVVIYGADKSHLTPLELDADINPTEQENRETTASDEIISLLGNVTEETDNDNESLQKMPSETSSEGSKRVNRRILRRLSAKFGVAYKVINDPELKARGYYDSKANVVIINEAYATADTAFHEFAHPFVSAIKKSNPTLYANLIAEVNNSEEGRKVLEEVALKYPELSKTKQSEEAMVQMLGMLAADKVSSPSLKTALKELWDAIVTTLKSIFQKGSDRIPSDLSPSASLGDIANMLVDKSTIDLDRRNDVKARQILRKLKNVLNDTVSVTKASEIMGAEQKAVFDKVAKAGFLVNNRYVVRQKDDINTDVPLEFRVPMDKDNWMKDLREIYPEAKIVKKEQSGFEGFKKFRVSLDGDNVATVYKPTNELAGSLNNTVSAGIYWSRVNPTIATGKEGEYNMDKKLFNGLNFHLDSFPMDDVNQGSFEQSFIAYTEASIKEKMNMTNSSLGEVVQAFHNLSTDKKEGVAKAIIDSAIQKSVNNFNAITDENKLRGDMSKVVDVNFIKNVVAKNSDEIFRSLTVENYDSTPEVNDAIKGLKKMVTMSSFLYKNKDTIHSNGKAISTQAIVADIVKRTTETAEKRIAAIKKVPVIGKLFTKIMDTSSTVKEWTYMMLTPEVFSNLVAGNESSFLHSLLYDAMNEGEGKDRDFKREAHKVFLDGLDKSSRDLKMRMTEWSTNFGKDRDEIIADSKNTMTVALKDGGSLKMTKGEALGLYMSMNRPRARRLKTPQGIKFIVNGKKYVISQSELLSLQGKVEKDGDMVAVRDAMYETFATTHPKVNQTMKNTMGIELDKDTNYYPLKFGIKDDVIASDGKRRIEDFSAIKEATYNPDGMQGSLRIEDSIDVFTSHIDSSANYYAYAEPIHNLRKVYDAMSKDENYDETTHISIKKYLRSLTDSVQDYTLLAGMTDTEIERKIQKSMNRFTVAVLGYNPSVMAKQVVSVVAASSELGKEMISNPEYRRVATNVISDSFKNTETRKGTQLSKGTLGKLNLDNPVIAEMMQKSSLAVQRFTGYIDREQGEMRAESINSLGKGNKTKILGKDLDLDKSMEGIKIMDAAAMAFIWSAVKDQMASKHSVGSDAYWTAVNEKFEQVVNRTQPTYGVVNRTQLGRSKSQFIRILTMFSSQRAKNMNMMIDAINSLLIDPNERTRLKAQYTLAAIGLWSSLSIAAIDKLKYTLYGNDDDEGIWENALGLGKGTLMTTLGNFYGIGQFASMVEANMTNKPFGKNLGHPVLQNFELAASALAHLGKGEIMKAGDKGLQTAMRLGGIPLFPYMTGRRLVKGAFGGDSKSGSSSSSSSSGGVKDKSPTYHKLNESQKDEVKKISRHYDKYELFEKASEYRRGITVNDKMSKNEISALLYDSGYRVPTKKRKKKTKK